MDHKACKRPVRNLIHGSPSTTIDIPKQAESGLNGSLVSNLNQRLVSNNLFTARLINLMSLCLVVLLHSFPSCTMDAMSFLSVKKPNTSSLASLSVGGNTPGFSTQWPRVELGTAPPRGSRGVRRSAALGIVWAQGGPSRPARAERKRKGGMDGWRTPVTSPNKWSIVV